MNRAKKTIRPVLIGLKMLLTLLSSASIGLGINTAKGAQPDTQSQFLQQGVTNQANVNKIALAIQHMSGKYPTAQNIQAGMTYALSLYPGTTIETLANALNKMNLKGAALSNAIEGAAKSFQTSTTHVVSNLITESYMNGGKRAAQKTIHQLRKIGGNKIVDDALALSQFSTNTSANDLSKIEPSSGDLYNG